MSSSDSILARRRSILLFGRSIEERTGDMMKDAMYEERTRLHGLIARGIVIEVFVKYTR